MNPVQIMSLTHSQSKSKMNIEKRGKNFSFTQVPPIHYSDYGILFSHRLDLKLESLD